MPRSISLPTDSGLMSEASAECRRLLAAGQRLPVSKTESCGDSSSRIEPTGGAFATCSGEVTEPSRPRLGQKRPCLSQRAAHAESKADLAHPPVARSRIGLLIHSAVPGIAKYETL